MSEEEYKEEIERLMEELAKQRARMNEQHKLATVDIKRLLYRLYKATKSRDKIIKGLVEKMIISKSQAYELVGIFTEEEASRYKKLVYEIELIYFY